MTWWRDSFTDTFAYALPSGRGADGERTYSSVVTGVAGRLVYTTERTQTVDEQEVVTTHRLATEAPLVQGARVWVDGADTTSVAAALSVRSVARASDLGGAGTLYEVRLS
jgi:hypothetical protein